MVTVARSRSVPRLRTALVAGLATAIGAYLILAAAIGFPGSYEASFADVVYRDVAVLHKPVDPRDIDQMARLLGPARAAFLDMVYAQTVGQRSVLGRAHLTRAAGELDRGLRLSPADAYAWTRRALVLVQMQGPNDAAARALSTALMIAPHDRKLGPIQLDLAVLLWPKMGDEAHEALTRRLRFITREPDLRSQARAFGATELGRKLMMQR